MATLQPYEKARMYAIGGVARGGATRGGYVSGLTFITVNGVRVGTMRDAPPITPVPGGQFGVILSSLTITDTLNEVPNTCNFRIAGWVPPQRSPVKITMGTQNTLTPLFAGVALTVDQGYAVGNPANLEGDVHAVDHTWQLGWTHVTARYVGWSATAIIIDILTRFGAVANGFTYNNVDRNLPGIDEITFTEEELPTAISRVCARIGAYWYADYLKDVHAFFDETGNGVPRTLDKNHPSLANVRHTGESTQALSRVFVEGQGARVIGHVTSGDTAIPLDTVAPFEVAADLFAKVSFQGSDGGAQYLTFNEVVPGGGGALVGPGVAPSAGVSLVASAGGNITTGDHFYAYSWVTAAGETKPSPAIKIQVAPVTPPSTSAVNLTTKPTNGATQGCFLTPGDTVSFAIAFEMRDAQNQNPKATTIGPTSAAITLVNNNDAFNPNQAAPVQMDIPTSPDPSVSYILIYMRSTIYAAAGMRLTLREPNHGGSSWHLSTAGWSYNTTGPQPVAANETGRATVAVSGIAVGPSAVTSRKLYRTEADLATLKLLTTLANNTATTFTDTASDSALGAVAPTNDTSGLQQPAGTVLPGETLFPVAGTGGFRATGGWAVIGNGEQTIRYSGIAGNQITGIPASGLGAITAAIAFNSTITSAPMLMGIPATGDRAIGVKGITEGDEVYLVVQRDNETTRSALATSVGGNGIREEWIQDRRLSAREARLRGDATLAMRPLDQFTLSYTCRDILTRSGKSIWVTLWDTLPKPIWIVIYGTYKVQTVTISNFRPYPNQYPTYSVQASSQRFSFEDWLRILKSVES